MKYTFLLITVMVPLAMSWRTTERPYYSSRWDSSEQDRETPWKFDLRGDYDRYRGLQARAELSYNRDNFRGYLRGTLDSYGGYGIGAGVSWRWKRSVENNDERFNVTLRADPCNFIAYDLNRDGLVTVQEFQEIFGFSDFARHFFNSLDKMTGDGVLEEREFKMMAEKMITECQPSAE